MTARTLFAAAATAALILVGCTEPGTDAEPVGGDCYAEPDRCMNPDATRYQYVVDSVRLPTNALDARDLGLDIDSDGFGKTDNALGSMLTALDNLSDFELQTVIDDAINKGSLILLVDVHADDMMNTTGAGGRMLFGIDELPSACNGTFDNECRRHLSGEGAFGIDDEAVIDATLAGDIADGTFVGGPSRITTDVFLEGVTPVPVTVDGIGVRARVTTSEPGRLRGVIGGALTTEQALEVVLPVITELAVTDCSDSGSACCKPGSVGAALVQFFDSDADCYLGFDELAANTTIRTLFTPDLDLLDGDGNFRPNYDGIADSISLGAEFTAVPAAF